jgi:hypothetical protein
MTRPTSFCRKTNEGSFTHPFLKYIFALRFETAQACPRPCVLKLVTPLNYEFIDK